MTLKQLLRSDLRGVKSALKSIKPSTLEEFEEAVESNSSKDAYKVIEGVYNLFPESGLVHLMPNWSSICKAKEKLEREINNG